MSYIFVYIINEMLLYTQGKITVGLTTGIVPYKLHKLICRGLIFITEWKTDTVRVL